MEGVLAIGLLVHGFGHVVGFVVPWRFAEIGGLHPTSAFFERLELGGEVARLVGLAWLGVAGLFGVAGAALWLGLPWAAGLTLATTLVSTALCVLGLPDTLVSLAGDAVIVAVLAIATALA